MLYNRTSIIQTVLVTVLLEYCVTGVFSIREALRKIYNRNSTALHISELTFHKFYGQDIYIYETSDI